MTTIKVLSVQPGWIETVEHGPGVQVTAVHCRIDRLGRPTSPQDFRRVRVPVDLAGDLADESVAWMQSVAGDRYGTNEWMVGGLGFTEDEAVSACQRAIDEAVKSLT